MGNPGKNDNYLSQEVDRISSFGDHKFSVAVRELARAGFFYTQKEGIVRCFLCHFEFDAIEIEPTLCIIRFHKEQRPDCTFAKKLAIPETIKRIKMFTSYDSLRYEKERLETFIEWPVSWLKPEDLALDGFYFLRTADHCACVFCRGIVGAWEVGDTPRGEHKRHFPRCPFIRGQPVGNIPIKEGKILSRLMSNPAASRTQATVVVDVGHLATQRPEISGPPMKNGPNFEHFGCLQFTIPKRKDFLTKEDRLTSYKNWPELVKQKPEELADAGFFYCGLSDHVRCFHCGNGLRNWEEDDQPWIEHARWYPECTFVNLTKGKEFVDKVRHERPPYIRQHRSFRADSTKATPDRQFISDSELDILLWLDVMQAVLAMGFPKDSVRGSLRHKLEQTGQPFFNQESCIEATLQYMEERTRQTLQKRASQEAEEGARAQHSAGEEQSVEESDDAPPSPSPTVLSTTPISVASASSVSTSTTPASSTNTFTSSVSVPLTSVPVSASLQLSSAPQNSTITTEEDMEVDDPASLTTVTVAAAEDSAQAVNLVNVMNENTALSEEEMYPTTADPPEQQNEAPATEEKEELSEESSTSKILNSNSASESGQSSKELAEELEKIRDRRMCKVCMDVDMDVVFLPCQHMVTCSACAVAISTCPVCREPVKYYIKPILS